jgi:2-oxoglutarate ferredoxin oxidoreductase subunit alpha
MPDWATIGKTPDRERNIITSLDLDPARHERHNLKLQEKYRKIEKKEVLFEEINCDDAEYLFVAYGTSSRISQKSIQLARDEGIKVGLFRPITLWPFPKDRIAELSNRVKGMLSVEMSAGQLVEDVKLAVERKIKVDHYGRMGGMIPTPEEIVEALKKQIIGG